MILIVVWVTLLLYGHPLDQWYWRNPLPQGNSLASVVFAQGRFVAVGGGGVIITSADGTNWTNQTSPTLNSLAHVAYFDDHFLAVGERGTVLSSPNGENWTIIPSNVTNALSSVAYGNGSFVIVGSQGTVLQSSTGQNWMKLPGISTSLYLNSVTFGAGTFIGISRSGDVIQSADGIVWAKQPSLGGYPRQVAYLNERFIILDENMWSSPDGTNWVSTWVYSAPDAVMFTNGYYVGVGGGGVVYVSTNGTQWSWTTSYQSSGDLKGITFGNGFYAAVGEDGLIRTSLDRTNWLFQSRSLTYGGKLYGVEYINGEFVAAGEGSADEKSPVLFSGGSGNWYRRNTSVFSTIWDVTYGKGVYVLVDSFGIQTSTNGVDWTYQPSGLSGQLASVKYLSNLFLLTGWNGCISTSADGLTWTPRSSGTTRNLWGATFGKGVYVVVGQSFSSTGTTLTSADGVNWTNRSASNLRDVCFGKELFVAVGDGGHIQSSSNAVNWTTQSSGTTVTLYGVGYGDGFFLAVGDQGTLLTSPDGVNWTRRNSTTVQSLQRVAFGQGTFVVTGSGSTLLQSSPTVPTLHLFQLPDSSRFELELIGGLDREHTVETCSSLESGIWTSLVTLPFDQRHIVDADTAKPQKSYRVRVP